MSQPPTPRSVLVLLPVYNDWEPLNRLLDLIDAVLAGLDLKATVLIVDDASTEPMGTTSMRRRFVALSEIHLLSLRRNLGHQRAIAVGLAFAHENFSNDMVLVMDADGQDAPQDFSKLLMRYESTNGQAVVFARRKRRSEGLGFRFFYYWFRVIHRLLTGHAARVGNFSLMPRHLLRRIMVLPELWNNYSAAIYKARLPIETVSVNRAKRIAGKTHMRFSTLVAHGLSAMSVFNDVIGIRTLSTAIVLTLGTFVWAVVLCLYVFHWNIHYEAWLFGVLILLGFLIVICGVLATFLLSTLAHRTTTTFLPLRDYRFYYDSAQRLDQ